MDFRARLLRVLWLQTHSLTSPAFFSSLLVFCFLRCTSQPVGVWGITHFRIQWHRHHTRESCFHRSWHGELLENLPFFLCEDCFYHQPSAYTYFIPSLVLRGSVGSQTHPPPPTQPHFSSFLSCYCALAFCLIVFAPPSVLPLLKLVPPSTFRSQPKCQPLRELFSDPPRVKQCPPTASASSWPVITLYICLLCLSATLIPLVHLVLRTYLVISMR